VTLDDDEAPIAIFARSQSSNPRALTAFTDTMLPGAICGSTACGRVTGQ
jgi:hypothetical protein